MNTLCPSAASRLSRISCTYFMMTLSWAPLYFLPADIFPWLTQSWASGSASRQAGLLQWNIFLPLPGNPVFPRQSLLSPCHGLPRFPLLFLPRSGPPAPAAQPGVPAGRYLWKGSWIKLINILSIFQLLLYQPHHIAGRGHF